MNRSDSLSEVGEVAVGLHTVEVSNSSERLTHRNGDSQGQATVPSFDDPFASLIETLLIEIYRCTVCKSFFTQKPVIESHIRLHHSAETRQDASAGVQTVLPVTSPEGGPKGGLDERCRVDKDALSNLLEVLVGLGNSSLVAEDTQRTSKGRAPSQSHRTLGDGGSVTVSNLSGVPLDAGKSLIVPVESQDGSRPPDTAIAAESSRGRGHGLTNCHRKVPTRSDGVSDEERNRLLPVQDVPTFEQDYGNVLENGPTVRLKAIKQPNDEGSEIFILDQTPIGDNMEVLLDQPPQRIAGGGQSANPETRHRSGEELSLEGVPSFEYQVIPASVKEDSKGTEDKQGPSGIRQISLHINQLVRSASMSNPDASSIIVMTQTQDDKPPEELHFKRSWKSNAVIPTARSLGIVSPFQKRRQTNKKRFPCQTCSSRYVTAAELVNHITKKHLRAKKFLCEVCGVAMATKGALRNHVLVKHSSSVSTFQCETCDYATRHEKHFKNHMTKHGRGFWCQACNQTFSSAARLSKHCQSLVHIHRVEPLACQHCEYTTYKKDNLKVHMRKHDDERPYKCMQCDYASRDGGTLKKHVMAKHSKIRPHQCSQCDFSSIDKRGLNIHLRKHTGERPFKCSLCNYSARRRNNLNNHLRTHNIPPTPSDVSGGIPVHVLSDLP